MPDDKSKALKAGLKGRCPSCYEGPLFDGFLTFASRCSACGYDNEANDIADGPAVFVIMLASFLVVPPALVFQIKLDPPIWLTLIIWVPAIVIACLLLLRPFRGLMFALQIATNAEMGNSVEAGQASADSGASRDEN